MNKEPKYMEGTVLIDLKHNELFRYKHSRDGFMVENNADRIRTATQQEIDTIGIED